MAELQLDALESKGLIRVAAITPELEYLFRHALVQDAAYESLLKQERRTLHRLVGDALEELYPERHGELAAVLARHFEQAGQPDKAIEYLVAAARFAWDRNAIVEAYDLYGRAAQLLPPPSADDDEGLRHARVEIELGRLKSGLSFLDEGTLMELIPRLVAEASKVSDVRLEAEVHLHVALLRSYRGERHDTSPQLKQSLDRVAEIALELGDPTIDALPKSLIGLFQVFSGDLREGVETLTAVAPLLEQKRDFVGSSFALVALAIGLSRLGEFEAAANAAHRASEVARDGDVIAKLDAQIGESVVLSVRGDLDEAVRLGRQCIDMAEQAGAMGCVVSSSFFLGDAYMRNNQFSEARTAFERGSTIATVTEMKVFRPSISAYLRSTLASLGGTGMLNVLSFEEALAEARSMNDRWSAANVIWKRGETVAKQPDGDVEQALADYAVAADMFAEMGARPFLARVQRDWGEALRRVGQQQESDEKLRAALEQFRDLGIERDAKEVEAVLSA